MIWPENPALECLITSDIRQVPPELKEAFTRKLLANGQRDYRKFNNASRDYKFVDGPANINIDGIASLALPVGYVYAEAPRGPFWSWEQEGCLRYIMQKDDWHGRVCLNVEDIGHVNLKGMQAELSSQIAAIQTALVQWKPTMQFSWGEKPTVDEENNTLRWSYQYDNTQDANALAKYAKFYNSVSLIKFGKVHAVWLRGENFSDNEWSKDRLALFSDSLTFTPENSYQQKLRVSCTTLARGDTALGGNYYDYLPGTDRCFPYFASVFITGLRKSNDNTWFIASYLNSNSKVRTF